MSCDITWVELRGFEPLTPSMRTRCATGLRHSPKNVSQPSKGQRLLARSVAHRAQLGVGVLVVELVADVLGEVDDVSPGAGLFDRERTLGRAGGRSRRRGRGRGRAGRR